MGRLSNAERAERDAEQHELTTEEVGAIKHGAARLPKITYTPQGDGAPYETIWNRHRFRANVPVAVKDVPTGLSGAEMVAMAKTNPHFAVEGFEPAKIVNATPDTPERYRSYAVGWIRMANSSDEMLKRWKNEAELREECGTGPDDVEYLQTIFNPRLAILKDSEKLALSAVND